MSLIRPESLLRSKLGLERRQGLLGKDDSTLRDTDSGRYWVRPEKYPGVYAAAVRLPLKKGAVLAPRANLVVEIGVDETGQTVIMGLNQQAAILQGVSAFAQNPADPMARGLIRQEEIGPLLAYHTPGVVWSASVASGVVVIQGKSLVFTGGTLDLITYKPSTGQHRYVAVYLTHAGALGAAGSTAQADSSALDSTDLDEALAGMPIGSLPLRAFVFDGDESDFSDSTLTAVDLRNLWGASVALSGAFSIVRAATTANITLSGAQTIDGVSVVAGDRVLVKNQSTASQNGVYTAASGAWSRAVDTIRGAMLVRVQEGTANADTEWTLTTNEPITVGSTSLTFSNTTSLTDHGTLAGLSDDDHTIYLLAAGTRDLTKLVFADSTELTIATGAITVTQSHHTVDTEANAASDDLDTINGAADGMVLYLRADHTDRTVVLKHNTGNIVTPDGSDVSLDSTSKVAHLLYSGAVSKWIVVNVGGGSGIAGVDVEEAGSEIVTDATRFDFKDFNIEDDGSGQAGVYHNLPGICEGRLTLTSGTSVTTSDVTAATTIYFALHKGNKVSLYDGTRWKVYTFTERSISVPATTVTIYDLFLYDNAGTLTLEATAWTNDTTRATALTTQDGVLVKSGATTRRYLGSFRTTGSSGQTEDSVTKRFVWNYYNRVERELKVTESTDNWSYATATWRSANNSTANRVEVVIGVVEGLVSLQVIGYVVMEAGEAGAVGIGINSTSANSADIYSEAANAGNFPISAALRHYQSVGYSYYQWLEYTRAGTVLFYGDGLVTVQCGMSGSVWG